MKASFALGFLLPLVLAYDYTVGVGKDENTGKKGVGFDPSVINPAAGDTIVFEFRSGSHSVVQSTFDQPCTPKEGGFNSGVHTVADNLDVDAPGLPQMRLLVNDTEPLWFYDQAGGTCNKGGVLSANPTGTQTAAAFKGNAAKAVVFSASPSSTNVGSSGSTASQTAPPTASSSTSNSGFRVGVSAVAILFGLLLGLL